MKWTCDIYFEVQPSLPVARCPAQRLASKMLSKHTLLLPGVYGRLVLTISFLIALGPVSADNPHSLMI
jgi:hypothetical protein